MTRGTFTALYAELVGTSQVVRVRSASCPCQARSGKPCAPGGDHLARYLAAERAGAISRDELKAAIGTLTVLAAHVLVVADQETNPGPPRRRRPL